VPGVNGVLDRTPASPLIRVEELIREIAPPTIAGLHRGRTWFAPLVRPRDWRSDEFGVPPEGRTPATGVPALRTRLADHLWVKGHTDTTVDRIVVTGGATHGVALVFAAVLEPGDEVVVLSPQWLFAAGLVRAARGVPREVPVFLELDRDPAFDLVEALERVIGPRTRAVYFNNLNNPTGVRLDRDALAELVDVAHRHDLWLVSDNAYDNYDFTEAGYADAATLPGAAERTFSLYSFSKTHSMPGYRVGYLVCPPGLGDRMAKWALYSIDGVSSVAQFAAFEALATPLSALDERRALAREARDAAESTLKVPHTTVEGGLFTFLDVSGYAAGAEAFLRRCVEAGVSLAPGAAFGGHCADHCRLCFTAVPIAELTDAIDRVNTVYLEGSDGR
jgi:aspartate aminotransferase